MTYIANEPTQVIMYKDQEGNIFNSREEAIESNNRSDCWNQLCIGGLGGGSAEAALDIMMDNPKMFAAFLGYDDAT